MDDLRTRGRQVPRWALAVITVVVVAIVAVAIVLVIPGGDDGAPGGGQPGDNLLVEPIPIDSVDIRIAESYPPQIFVDVTGHLPDACWTAREPAIERDGHTITVRIIGERPRDAFCAQVIQPYQKVVALGSFSEPGDYTVQVNDTTATFHLD